MSGYLKRIIAVAGAARSRVHPFVDSRYRQVRREENAGPVVVDETNTVAAPRAATKANLRQDASQVERVVQDDMRHEVKAAAPPTLARREDGVDLTRRPIRDRTSEAHEQGEEFKPLLPRLADVPVPISEAKTAETSEREGPVAARDATNFREEDRSGVARATKVWKFQPLIVREEEARVAGTLGVESTPPALRPATQMMQREATQARRVAVPSGIVQRPVEARSDDIQIHIGRIEVTAVHPPAPRPVPAPARKTMSLDEYLRGGNSGRA